MMDARVIAAIKRIESLRSTIEAISYEKSLIKECVDELKMNFDNQIRQKDEVLNSKVNSMLQSLREEYEGDCIITSHFKESANSVCIQALITQNEDVLSKEMLKLKYEYDLKIKMELESRQSNFDKLLDFKIEEALNANEELHEKKLNSIVESHRARICELENEYPLDSF